MFATSSPSRVRVGNCRFRGGHFSSHKIAGRVLRPFLLKSSSVAVYRLLVNPLTLSRTTPQHLATMQTVRADFGAAFRTRCVPSVHAQAAHAPAPYLHARVHGGPGWGRDPPGRALPAAPGIACPHTCALLAKVRLRGVSLCSWVHPEGAQARAGLRCPAWPALRQSAPSSPAPPPRHCIG